MPKETKNFVLLQRKVNAERKRTEELELKFNNFVQNYQNEMNKKAYEVKIEKLYGQLMAAQNHFDVLNSHFEKEKQKLARKQHAVDSGELSKKEERDFEIIQRKAKLNEKNRVSIYK